MLTVFDWLARIDVVNQDSLLIAPLVEIPASKLRAVVCADDIGIAY
jgi:hypothetical protein